LKAFLPFRIASILIVLFALGHTLGFRQTDPRWGIDSALATLKSTWFTTQGFHRTYWDFFVGFGLFVTVFLLFSALAAWQLAATPAPELRRLRPLAWSLTLSYAAVLVLSYRFFFLAPVLFSALILVCLLAGTLLS
jgi:hypothetical protein